VEIAELFDLPFLNLVARAHDVYVRHHPENEAQLSTLLSIKTGGCVEDSAIATSPRTPRQG
jgi:biotin synthase